jgi:hypothetical protein
MIPQWSQMKNTTKHKKPSKEKQIKELAGQLEQDLKQTIPLAIQPDGSVVYKNFVVRKNARENWDLHYINSDAVIEEYYLKSCALLAARAYSKTDINKFFEIKRLDSQYWNSHSDSQVYQKNIKTAKDFGRYLILLNKFEDSRDRAEYYQQKISTMFKWSFV